MFPVVWFATFSSCIILITSSRMEDVDSVNLSILLLHFQHTQFIFLFVQCVYLIFPMNVTLFCLVPFRDHVCLDCTYFCEFLTQYYKQCSCPCIWICILFCFLFVCLFCFFSYIPWSYAPQVWKQKWVPIQTPFEGVLISFDVNLCKQRNVGRVKTRITTANGILNEVYRREK